MIVALKYVENYEQLQYILTPHLSLILINTQQRVRQSKRNRKFCNTELNEIRKDTQQKGICGTDTRVILY